MSSTPRPSAGRSPQLPPLTFTEEQELLRKTARRFLEDKSGTDAVRELMMTEDGFDPDHWREIAGMGWQGMVVPEEHGGAGYGWVELSVLFEEAGRALLCAPLLSTTLGTAALLAAGTDEQRSAHLPSIAAGETRITVALPPAGPGDEATVRLEDGRLRGRASFVLDGHTADLVVVPTATGEAFLVPGDADGLTREPLPVMDLTRKQASLAFDAVAVDDGDRLEGDRLVADVRTAGVVMLACEQVGLAQAVHERATAYAKDRKQFGRSIGSFQALKHLLADLLVEVEAARSTAYHAARVLADGDADELAIAAPMAKSKCSEAAFHVAAENIQVHGGIGFTWEHDAHLYLKRAKSSELLFGPPAAHRRSLGDALGL